MDAFPDRRFGARLVSFAIGMVSFAFTTALILGHPGAALA